MRSQMIRWSLIGSAVLALSACGPDYVPVTISGFAATGAAMANASVTAKCVAGPELTGTTDADGSFVLTLNNQTAPCIVRVSSGGVTLHSFADGSGRLNVTPLTELSVAKALGADPSTVFSGFNNVNASTISGGLNAAKVLIKSQVEALTGASISGDLFTSTFKVGDPDDVVLDKLNAKLQAINRPLTDLKASIAGGGNLIPAVQAAARGTLIGDLAPAQPIPAQVLNVTAPALLVQLTGQARCGVAVHQIHYNTVGILGEPATASGALLVPTGCAANGALIAYAKGTDVDRTRTLASTNDGETMLLVMMYAAQGYTVVATDYLGFAKSNYNFHPYLHADTQASSMIDAIRAARAAAQPQRLNLSLSGQVMLTGYSQGGHASMAAQKTIESDAALKAEIDIVAAAHLAGPYNMAQSLAMNAPILGYQVFTPYLLTAWQKIYNNVYGKPSDVFKAPYAAYIESLLPSSTYSYDSLFTSGKLPFVAPDQAQALMFEPAYLQAAQASESHPLRVAGLKNHLLGWGPKADVMLCSGSGDPTVPFGLHQAVAYQDLNSRATAPGRTLATVSPTAFRAQPVGTVLYYEVTGSAAGSVWGSGVYSDDSEVAAAAVHAGVLTVGQTGVVKVTLMGSQSSFTGSAANGVNSSSWSAYPGSYSVTAAGTAEKVTSVDVHNQVIAIYSPSYDITKYHGTYVPPLCHSRARQFFNSKLPV